MTVKLERIWRLGCKYLVGKPNEFCVKCGHCHNETEAEAFPESVKPKPLKKKKRV